MPSAEISILCLTSLAARLHAASPAEFERLVEYLRDRVENLEALARIDAALASASGRTDDDRGKTS